MVEYDKIDIPFSFGLIVYFLILDFRSYNRNPSILDMKFLSNFKLTKMKDKIIKSKFYLLFIYIIVMVSCSEKADDISSNKNAYDIYICGKSFNGVGYWKNDIPVILDNQFETVSSDIFLSAGDVYCASNDYRKAYTVQYWKDKNSIFLDSNNFCRSSAIYVENSNVYVVGNFINRGKREAGYWKNSIKIPLQPVINNNSPASLASDVIVHNGDVYITGGISDKGAVYWKNGEAITLENNDPTNSVAYKIFIDESDIYICGYIGNKAVYWKNGSLNYLSGGVNNTVAYSIFVKDSTIHLVGIEKDKSNMSKAVYWKNGKFQYLSGSISTAEDIVIVDQDVYITGDVVKANNDSKAVYWKNGVEHTLADVGYATSIFAIKK